VTDEELTAAIHAARDRARANAPQGALGLEGVHAADLTPLVHARDAAEAKVGAIGTVNPRPGGLVNSIAQAGKRLVARLLDWHVREQTEFNRASMDCVEATMEGFNQLNRSLAALAGRLEEVRKELDAAKISEDRRIEGEIRMLRTISELQAAYSHRLTLQQENHRELMRGQHRDFEGAMDRRTVEIQQRLWDDLAKSRMEFERVIHHELRMLRQRPVVASIAAPLAAEAPVDWTAFAARFRGSEDRIRGQQQRYIDKFAGTTGQILDIGCGRGEFLEAARAAGLFALGLDLNPACVDECRAKGLDAECTDLFAYLTALPDQSLGGVYCSQVVEHLTPVQVAHLIELLGRKMRTGGLVAIETPNPECLAIFATHFYIDPTHTRPVPALLLRYYFEEAGFGGIEVEYLEPAIDSMPELAHLAKPLRDRFFGGLDYSVFARKL
jgi:O-antigen chain-terminating methyltransferase